MEKNKTWHKLDIIKSRWKEIKDYNQQVEYHEIRTANERNIFIDKNKILNESKIDRAEIKNNDNIGSVYITSTKSGFSHQQKFSHFLPTKKLTIITSE